MNHQVWEFWSRVFLAAAHSQKQLEEFLAWQQQHLELLAKCCPWLPPSRQDKAEVPTPTGLAPWQELANQLAASYRQFLNLWGLVPRQEYDDLQQECQSLKAKVAEQEETIRLLRQLLDEKGLGLAATALEFQKLVEKQGEQFQKFLQGLGESLTLQPAKTKPS